ncbi:hypothetical protein HMPREF0004_0060 [Achromobacter piechaudii ATCC 43553]|uniref:Uncharacterized protein n=1 Tax=Achromobacter piechaudii ATCC 43553 TaxID=742159 RepID=D4X3L3_9BURK|nr:hypothetical protein HMPREF0004_0060 [Achromobacter piechaudii ATCC 43553]
MVKDCSSEFCKIMKYTLNSWIHLMCNPSVNPKTHHQNSAYFSPY